MAMQALLGLRDFWEANRIISLAMPATGAQNGEPLLLFATSKQHTWLVCFTTELCCVMDDVRRSAPDVRWRMNRDELMEGSALKIAITTEDFRPVTGKLNFGPYHRGWLYSVGLFQDKKAEDAVRELIERNMSQQLPASAQVTA
jgi:hypothetical protein